MIDASWLWAIIEWLSLPVLAVLLGIMLWRKIYREFPFFFAYVLITEGAALIRVAAQFSRPLTYFYVYWISDLLISFFYLFVVYELFAKRIFPRYYKIGIYRYLFPFAAVAAMILGCLAAFAPRNMGVLALEDRILDAILVVLLLFFGLLMLLMGRRWTRYEFCISFGFAIYAAAFLIATTMWAQSRYFGKGLDIPVIAYDISALVWLFSFWSPERTSEQAQAITPELVSEARAWQSLLRNWISSKKS
jgi:hypothetical protein